MITIGDIAGVLNQWAPPGLQESWDNSGLIAGDPGAEARGILVCIDVTAHVIEEAISLGCNLVVSHHPPVFAGLKRFTSRDEEAVPLIKAIENRIALFACHTNLDSIPEGVSGLLAKKLNLRETSVLAPREKDLLKLVFFVPSSHADPVSEAIFRSGAGTIGKYDLCSFRSGGVGTFRGGEGTQPFTGVKGEWSKEEELRIETILPKHLAGKVVEALIKSHPYEEVAYDLYPLENSNPAFGMGIKGLLPEPMETGAFLRNVCEKLGIQALRYSSSDVKVIRKVAVCGGSGSGFTTKAIAAGCDAFITGDIKYHDWFRGTGGLLLVDVGHYESEQFAMQGIYHSLIEKFPTFAVHLTEVNTNPINYYLSI